MAEPVPTIVLLASAVLVLVMFYLLRSISRRRAIMKFLVEKGALRMKPGAAAVASPAAAAAAKKAGRPARKKARKKGRR